MASTAEVMDPRPVQINEDNRQIAGYSSDQEVTNAATILCEVSSLNSAQQGLSGDISPEDGNKADEETYAAGERRSKRKRRPVKRLSPLEEEPSEKLDEKNASSASGTGDVPSKKRPAPRKAIGRETFACDHCGSNFIIDPSLCRKRGSSRRTWRVSVRYWIDPETNKRLRLCNACGLRAYRHQNPVSERNKPAISEQDKQKYLEHVREFSSSLVKELNDLDAEKLTCPNIRVRTPCGCVQKFIIGEGNMEEAKNRAHKLLSWVKEAQRLRSKKFYNVEEMLKKGKRHRKVGMGNGQRKSVEYEQFVLEKRRLMKEDMKFCEHAVKRILMYSNNFLHKKLKTDPENNRRLERTRSTSKKSVLKNIDDLANDHCCHEKCVLLSKTHSVLLSKWRERAQQGQTEARKVLAEMLTPSGLKTNCFRFINMVTGCSTITIGRVEEQMRRTGGDREPPKHGLKKYWEQQPRPPKLTKGPGPAQFTTISLGTGQRNPSKTASLSVNQLKEQQNQLKRLQQQLVMQQNQISQQQKLIEQQLALHEQTRKQQKQQQEEAAQQEAAQRAAQQTQELHSPLIIQHLPIGGPAGDTVINIQQLNPSDTDDSDVARVEENMQQILFEIQNQITNQQVFQIQQQLMSVSEDSNQSQTSSPSSDQPPPSYNVAVALSGTNPPATLQTGSDGQLVVSHSNGGQGEVIVQTVSFSDEQSADAEQLRAHSMNKRNPGPSIQDSVDGGNSDSAITHPVLVTLPEMMEVTALDAESLGSDIIVPENLTAQLAEALQLRHLKSQQSSHLNQDGEVRYLPDIEGTISNISTSQVDSTESVRHKKKHRGQSSSLLSNLSVESLLPSRESIQTRSSPDDNASIIRRSVELPGDTLMPSETLQVFGNPSHNLVLHSIPGSATIRHTTSSP